MSGERVLRAEERVCIVGGMDGEYLGGGGYWWRWWTDMVWGGRGEGGGGGGTE